MTKNDEGSEDGLPPPSADNSANGSDEVSAVRTPLTPSGMPVQLRRAFFEKAAFRKDSPPVVVVALESPSSARRTPKASNSVNRRWPISASSSSSSSSKSDQVIDTPPTGRKWKVKTRSTPACDLKEEKSTLDKPLVALPLSPLSSAANKESEKASMDKACGIPADTKQEEQAPSSTEKVAETSKTQPQDDIEKSTSDDISAFTLKETDESSKDTATEPVDADSGKQRVESVEPDSAIMPKIVESGDVEKQSETVLMTSTSTESSIVVVVASAASTEEAAEDDSVTKVSHQQVIEKSNSSTKQEEDDISTFTSKKETDEASEAIVDEPLEADTVKQKVEPAEAVMTDMPMITESDDAKKQSETVLVMANTSKKSSTTPVVESAASTKQAAETVSVTKVSKHNLPSPETVVVAKKSTRKSTGTLGVQTMGTSKPLDAIATPRKMILSPTLSSATTPRPPAFSQLRNVWANKAANRLDAKDMTTPGQQQQLAIMIQEEIDFEEEKKEDVPDACIEPFPKTQSFNSTEEETKIKVDDEECNSTISSHLSDGRITNAIVFPSSGQGDVPHVISRRSYESPVGAKATAAAIDATDDTNNDDRPTPIDKTSSAGPSFAIGKTPTISKDDKDDQSVASSQKSTGRPVFITKTTTLSKDKDDQSTASTIKSYGCPNTLSKDMDDRSAASSLPSAGRRTVKNTTTSTLSNDKDDQSIPSRISAITKTTTKDMEDQSTASSRKRAGLPVAITKTPPSSKDKDDQSITSHTSDGPILIANVSTIPKDREDQSVSSHNSENRPTVSKEGERSSIISKRPSPVVTRDIAPTASPADSEGAPLAKNWSEPKTYGQHPVSAKSISDKEVEQLAMAKKKLTTSIIKKDLKYTKLKTDARKEVTSPIVALMRMKFGEVESVPKVVKEVRSPVALMKMKFGELESVPKAVKEVTSPVALMKMKFGELGSVPKAVKEVTSPVALMKIKFGELESVPKVVKEVTSPVALMKKNLGEEESVPKVGKEVTSPVALMKKKFGEVDPVPELVQTPKSPGVSKLREMWGEKAAERRDDYIIDQDSPSTPEEKKKEDSMPPIDSQKWIRRQSRNKALAATFKKMRTTSPRLLNKVNTSKTAEDVYTLSTPVASMAANGSWRNDGKPKKNDSATTPTRWVPYHRFFAATATDASSGTTQVRPVSGQQLPSTGCIIQSIQAKSERSAMADAPQRDPADPPDAGVVENVYSEEGLIAPGLLQRADPPGKKTKTRRKRKESVLTDEIPESGAPWMSIEVVVESSSHTVSSAPASDQTAGAEYCFQEPRPKALKRDPSVDSSVWTKDDASLDWIGSMVSMPPKTSARLHPCSNNSGNFTSDLDRPTVLDSTVDSKPPIYGRAKKEVSSKSPNFDKPWSVSNVYDIENSEMDVVPRPAAVGSKTIAAENDTSFATVPEASKPVVFETVPPPASSHSALPVIEISDIDKVPTPSTVESKSAAAEETAPIPSQLMSLEAIPPQAPDRSATKEVISNQLDTSLGGTCSSDCDDFEAMLRSDAKMGDDIVNSVEVTVECKKEKTRIDTSIIIQEDVEQPASFVEIKEKSATEDPLQDSRLSQSTCLEKVETTSTSQEFSSATEQIIEKDTQLDTLPISTPQAKEDSNTCEIEPVTTVSETLPISTPQAKEDANTCEIETVPTVSETTTDTDEKKDIVESEHEHSTIDMCKSAHSMLEHARRTAQKIKEAKALTGQFSSMADPGHFQAPDSFVQQTIKRFEAEQNASYVPSHPMVKQVVSSWEAKNSSDMSSVAKAASFLSSLSGNHTDDTKEDKKPCEEVKVKRTISSLTEHTPKTEGSEDKSQQGLSIKVTTPTLEEPVLSTPLLPALSTPLASNVKTSTVQKVGNNGGLEELSPQYSTGKKMVGVKNTDKKCEEKDKITSSKIVTSILRDPSNSHATNGSGGGGGASKARRREFELSSENVQKLAARWDPESDTDNSFGKSSVDISVAVNQEVYNAGMALVTMEQRATKKRELSMRTHLLMTDSTDAGALTMNESIEDLQLPVVDQTRCLGDTACCIM